ncbi:MAG: DUF3467 domain-containing protein [Bacteroidales bacterium]|nr:DUF3467 domain-containing protein [Bacteroidales bacterium]
MSPDNAPSISIELGEDTPEIYSNLVVIANSPSDFILDFVRVMPGRPKARVMSRIILTPDHAKRLMLTLQDSVVKFEAEHGPINLGKAPASEMPPFSMNFGGGGEA